MQILLFRAFGIYEWAHRSLKSSFLLHASNNEEIVPVKITSAKVRRFSRILKPAITRLRGNRVRPCLNHWEACIQVCCSMNLTVKP